MLDKKKPLISTIIPTYNSEAFIIRAINSALNQTWNNVEVIVIDDGSTDNTYEKIKAYGSRIKYFFQKNKGVAEARNLGLSQATGEYISFLDADDYILPQFYSKMIKRINKETSELAACNMIYENEQGSRVYSYSIKNDCFKTKKSDKDLLKCFRQIGNSCCNKLFKASLIKNMKFKNYKRGEDALFLLEVFLKCNSVSFIADPLYVYLQNPSSVTHRTITVDDLENIKEIHFEKKNLIQEYNQYEKLKSSLFNYYYRCFYLYTSSIRQIKNKEERINCWLKWIEINKEYFLDSRTFFLLQSISKNLSWLYFSGIFISGYFVFPLFKRLNNPKYFFQQIISPLRVNKNG